MNTAISETKNIPLTGVLREEFDAQEFVDSWTEGLSWESGAHAHLTLATDVSLYGWAGVIVDGPGKGVEVHDYWGQVGDRPIHLKVAEAVINTLNSLAEVFHDLRILCMDNVMHM